MKLEYLLVIAFLVGMAICALIVYFSNKEQKKQIRDAVESTAKSWAACLASVEKSHDKENEAHKKETEALDRYIVSLQDLLAEKDERIKQLEADAALKNFVMSCARVDGTIDAAKLKSGLEKRGIHVPDFDTFWQDVSSYEE